jgi:hypothetical protein
MALASATSDVVKNVPQSGDLIDAVALSLKRAGAPEAGSTDRIALIAPSIAGAASGARADTAMRSASGRVAACSAVTERA